MALDWKPSYKRNMCCAASNVVLNISFRDLFREKENLKKTAILINYYLSL